MAIGNKRIENYVPVVKLNQGIYTEYDIETTGNLIVGGDVTLTDDLTLDDLTVTGDQTISGTLAVTGAQTFTGASTFNGAVAFNSTITGTTFHVTYVGQTTEAATDRVIFVANEACQLTAVREVHAVAAGGASTLQLTKDTGTTAPGAGTDLLTAGFDLNGTANSNQAGSLTATVADLQFAAGNRLSIDFANTIQSTAGLCITATFKRI